MTGEPTSQTSPRTAVPTNAQAVLTLLAMTQGLWTGETKRSAWWITVGIIVFTIGNLIAGLGIIQWNRYFFDALEKKNVTQVTLGVALIFGLALLLPSQLAARRQSIPPTDVTRHRGQAGGIGRGGPAVDHRARAGNPDVGDSRTGGRIARQE